MARTTALSGGINSDDQFEVAFAVPDGMLSYYLPDPVPRGVYADMVELMQVLARLKRTGYAPEFVIDVGASTGIWSKTVQGLFPGVRYVLVDPLLGRHGGSCLQPDFTLIEAAAGDHNGTIELMVASDLYNSSTMAIGSVSEKVETVRVPVRTVDDIAMELQLAGREILKVDVQFAEHLVLAGAGDLLRGQIDVVILELTLVRVVAGARTLPEMIALMTDLGFDYYDDVGSWRNPRSGRLEQKDVMFVRPGAFS